MNTLHILLKCWCIDKSKISDCRLSGIISGTSKSTMSGQKCDKVEYVSGSKTKMLLI